MSKAANYRIAVRSTVAEPIFEIDGRGVRTVLFCVVNAAGDTFAWCMEPTGMVGPFEAAVTVFGPLATIPGVSDAKDQPQATATDATPELRFTYGIPAEGYQTSPAHPAIRLARGARYVATAMGVSDGGVEHAATVFTAN
jgi:hypothetical protein